MHASVVFIVLFVAIQYVVAHRCEIAAFDIDLLGIDDQ
jgi:hypothetical protein